MNRAQRWFAIAFFVLTAALLHVGFMRWGWGKADTAVWHMQTLLIVEEKLWAEHRAANAPDPIWAAVDRGDEKPELSALEQPRREQVHYRVDMDFIARAVQRVRRDPAGYGFSTVGPPAPPAPHEYRADLQRVNMTDLELIAEHVERRRREYEAAFQAAIQRLHDDDPATYEKWRGLFEERRARLESVTRRQSFSSQLAEQFGREGVEGLHVRFGLKPPIGIAVGVILPLGMLFMGGFLALGTERRTQKAPTATAISTKEGD